MNQKQRNRDPMLPIKRQRPLDIKSIAHHMKSFVNKGDTNAMKTGVSTFLTEKRIN